jgi:hypothetical protein
MNWNIFKKKAKVNALSETQYNDVINRFRQNEPLDVIWYYLNSGNGSLRLDPNRSDFYQPELLEGLSRRLPGLAYRRFMTLHKRWVAGEQELLPVQGGSREVRESAGEAYEEMIQLLEPYRANMVLYNSNPELYYELLFTSKPYKEWIA